MRIVGHGCRILDRCSSVSDNAGAQTSEDRSGRKTTDLSSINDCREENRLGGCNNAMKERKEAGKMLVLWIFVVVHISL